MMRSLLTRIPLAAFLLAAPVFGQAFFYHSTAQQVLQIPGSAQGVSNVYGPIANATVTVCTGAYNGTACTKSSGNLATIYQDQAMQYPITQPIYAEVDGSFQFWINTTVGSYAFYTVSAPGYTSQSRTINVVPGGVTGVVQIANGGTGATTAAGANLNITGVTQTGTLGTSSQVSTFPGAVVTGNFNTILYPAPGTGTISAVLNAYPSGNLHIILGCGTYIDNLSWTSSYNWIQGSGQCTILEPNVSTSPLVNIHPASAGAALYYNSITDLSMVGNGMAVDGIQLNNLSSPSPHNDYNDFERLSISGFVNGISILGGALWTTLKDIKTTSNSKNGINIDTTQPVNALDVEDLIASDNTGYGVYALVSGSASWKFERPDIESNGSGILTSNCAGIYLNGENVGMVITHGYFEGNCLAGDVNSANIRLTGSYIYATAIDNNYFSYGNGANGCGIVDDATRGSGHFVNNYFAMQTSTCNYDVKIVNTDTTSGDSDFVVGPNTFANNGQLYSYGSPGGPITFESVINSGVTGLPIGSLYFPNGLSANVVTAPTVNVTTGYQVNGSYGASGQCMTSTGSASAWGSCATGSSGLSGMTAGQIPVAATASTVTSSIPTTGSGNVVLSTSSVLVTPNLGVPSAVTLTNAAGLPLTTGVTGTLPIANGGTGSTTAAGAISNLGLQPYGTLTTNDYCTYVSGTGIVCNSSGSGGGVADTTVAVTAGTQGANSCSTAANVTMTGLTTSMVVHAGYSASPSTLTGWGSTGGMVFQIWPSAANTASWEICNQTSSSITYSAITFNVGAN